MERRDFAEWEIKRGRWRRDLGKYLLFEPYYYGVLYGVWQVWPVRLSDSAGTKENSKAVEEKKELAPRLTLYRCLFPLSTESVG